MEFFLNAFTTIYTYAQHTWAILQQDFTLNVPNFVTSLFPDFPSQVTFSMLGTIFGVGFSTFLVITLVKWITD